MQPRSCPDAGRPSPPRRHGAAVRSAGRPLRRWVLGSAAALAASALLLGADRLEATDRTVSDQRARCLATANPSVRAVALERIRAAGGTDAAAALDAVADDRDDRRAVQGLAAIGRSDHSGARTKLRAVFENTRRSDAARGAAFLALARLERADGRSWSSLSDYASRHCRSGSRLGAIVAAAENAPRSSE